MMLEDMEEMFQSIDNGVTLAKMITYLASLPEKDTITIPFPTIPNNELERWLATPKDDNEMLLSNCINKVTPILSCEMANYFGDAMKEWGFVELDHWILVCAMSAPIAPIPPLILKDLYEMGLRCMRQDVMKDDNTDLFPLNNEYACTKSLSTLLDCYYKVHFTHKEKVIVFEMKKDIVKGDWRMLLCFGSED
jgi:hypothetical protein